MHEACRTGGCLDAYMEAPLAALDEYCALPDAESA
jgi:hypothetical protein